MSRNLWFSAFVTAMLVSPFSVFAQEELRVVEPFQLQRLDTQTGGFQLRANGVTETLVQTNPEAAVLPALAERWETSADGLKWTFFLRPNVTFHDGTAMTPEAVAASFKALLPTGNLIKNAKVKDVSAGDGTVTFTLEQPFAPFLAYLLDPAVPVLAPSSFASSGELTAIVATGPYRIEKAELPQGLDLVRHDSYWGDVAKIERVRVDGIPNPETRVNIALAGEGDLVLEIPTTAVSRIDRSGETHIVRAPVPRVVMMLVNVKKPQFADVEIRRALSFAVDRQAIARTIMGNEDLAANQYFPPAMKGWHFEDFKPQTLNVAEANRILDELGWKPGADGIREKDGTRFAGMMRTFPQRAYLPVIAEALQAQLKAIGFDLSIQVGESSLIPEAQNDGTLELGLGIRTMIYQVPDPVARLTSDFATDEPSTDATGATGWKSEEMRAAVAAYNLTTDPEARLPLQREMAEILQNELPVIPITFTDEKYAVSERLEGFVADPVMQTRPLNHLSFKD
ncbi:ABC transporter substrate-binding protein [Shinella yambaruensis]|uniref:ABC transporter substrate-binding protein n=1 Tax=Shinella yambaruensis TaxID=415996 RepID=A0ABQ5ZPI5_9HYPH|nr:ABC transporter substrate-binding protein [Shinella yambaruensis]MCJ8026302.1 ABC transporter substrate-binding protein [Shinella yambaruensis]MCU7981709.1 ABC transporter substrate-binding protein [Shinella yambaruensis]GLR53656.1 ABC transporter substrate-binding protein [Shinella yambaruensis]